MAIVTISRGTMSGGRELAELLCRRLNYRCLSREVLVTASERYGIPEYKLFAAIQKSPTILQRLTFSREKYLACIQAALCEEVKEDNIVYHGHAGHLLLRGVSHVLKIRIVADMEYRIKAAMNQNGISEKEAKKHIEEVDKQRIKWSKFLYGVDWQSPELYDLVFNLRHTDLEFVSSQVELALTHPKFQATTESKKEMNNLLIQSRIRAALAGLKDIELEQLSIIAEESKVTIAGRVRVETMVKEILDTVKEVEGVEEIIDHLEVDLRYRDIQS